MFRRSFRNKEENWKKKRRKRDRIIRSRPGKQRIFGPCTGFLVIIVSVFRNRLSDENETDENETEMIRSIMSFILDETGIKKIADAFMPKIYTARVCVPFLPSKNHKHRFQTSFALDCSCLSFLTTSFLFNSEFRPIQNVKGIVEWV